jgi:hypothetical protein
LAWDCGVNFHGTKKEKPLPRMCGGTPLYRDPSHLKEKARTTMNKLCNQWYSPDGCCWWWLKRHIQVTVLQVVIRRE